MSPHRRVLEEGSDSPHYFCAISHAFVMALPHVVTGSPRRIVAGHDSPTALARMNTRAPYIAVQQSIARSRLTASTSSAFAARIVISKHLARRSVLVLLPSLESPATRQRLNVKRPHHGRPARRYPWPLSRNRGVKWSEFLLKYTLVHVHVV